MYHIKAYIYFLITVALLSNFSVCQQPIQSACCSLQTAVLFYVKNRSLPNARVRFMFKQELQIFHTSTKKQKLKRQQFFANAKRFPNFLKVFGNKYVADNNVRILPCSSPEETLTPLAKLGKNISHYYQGSLKRFRNISFSTTPQLFSCSADPKKRTCWNSKKITLSKKNIISSHKCGKVHILKTSQKQEK